MICPAYLRLHGISVWNARLKALPKEWVYSALVFLVVVDIEAAQPMLRATIWRLQVIEFMSERWALMEPTGKVIIIYTLDDPAILLMKSIVKVVQGPGSKMHVFRNHTSQSPIRWSTVFESSESFALGPVSAWPGFGKLLGSPVCVVRYISSRIRRKTYWIPSLLGAYSKFWAKWPPSSWRGT